MEKTTGTHGTEDAVARIEDIAFVEVTNISGEQETLRLDIYLPPGQAAGPRPAVLWFHGGGFRPGNDKRQVYIPMFARAFAARGYVGIAPDYRLRDDAMSDFAGTIADCVADGRQALEWVRAHAAEYGIDPARLALAGGSAGGMLVLHLVHTATAPLEGVRAVIDLWGTPGGQWQHFGHIRTDCPPTFIVHGTGDELVPYENSQRLAAELERAGIQHTFLTIPGAPHTPLEHFEEMVKAVETFLSQFA